MRKRRGKETEQRAEGQKGCEKEKESIQGQRGREGEIKRIKRSREGVKNVKREGDKENRAEQRGSEKR